jgi:dihydroorotase
VQQLELTRPDDWHLHLRDGPAMASVLPASARQFARAIVMPNLKPPVTTTAQALAYRERILAALPAGMSFEPLMTIYLTDNTQPHEIRRAQESGFVHGVKLYPAGATTNSDSGVTDVRRCAAALEAMQGLGMPLLVHGEVTQVDVDVFDREKVFIERVMMPLRRDFPALRVVFEHITTREAADYVAAADGPVAATITAHHLLFNRNAIFMSADGRPSADRIITARPCSSARSIAEALLKAGERQPAFLPGHRFGAASEGEGKRLRLRGGAHGRVGARALCGSVRGGGRARPPGSLRVVSRAGLLLTCRVTHRRSHCAASRGLCRPNSHLARRRSSRCALAKRCGGSCWAERT